MKDLLFILGDQLSRSLSSLKTCSIENTVVLLAEVQEEATCAAHHKKKIAFVFSAMRRFARELQADGWRVDYVKLDNPFNSGSFSGEVKRALARYHPERVVLTEPGEWRVLQMVRGWEAELGIPVCILPDGRFLASHDEFERWAANRK
jgi:deoxyribodipyrimidine photolyase-related protein